MSRTLYRILDVRCSSADERQMQRKKTTECTHRIGLQPAAFCQTHCSSQQFFCLQKQSHDIAFVAFELSTGLQLLEMLLMRVCKTLQSREQFVYNKTAMCNLTQTYHSKTWKFSTLCSNYAHMHSLPIQPSLVLTPVMFTSTCWSSAWSRRLNLFYLGPPTNGDRLSVHKNSSN